jgi:activator of HSP90 ATPase
MSNNIHHSISFTASAERVYSALTDGAQFTSMSGGAPATLDASEGSEFSCFGGMIVGRQIELAPNRRIVQAWRVKSWPAGLYSIARFELVPDGAGTRIEFDHAGFPPDQQAHLDAGWHANYWEPLRKLLG